MQDDGPDNDYNYSDAGFNTFMSRSIDQTSSGTTLANLLAAYNPFSTNMEQTQITGQLGQQINVGNITIDGVNSRISVFDSNGNEVVRIGTL